MQRLVALALTAGLVLAACGGDDDTAATPPPTTAPAPTSPDATAQTTVTTAPATSAEPTGATTPSTTAAGSATTEPTAGPATIEHAFGTTEIDAVPERIVALDAQWTDVLTALGHPPVAAAVDPNQGGWYPWQTGEATEVIEVSSQMGIPYERIATYSPDLIVGSWVLAEQSAYDTLSQIAPTVASLGEGGETVDRWEDIAVAAGELLDEQEAAAALVAEIDQVGADLTGLDGKTYVLANYVPTDQIYVVADPDDGAAQLFARLGMSIDPDILALDTAGSGRIALSFEQIGELDADVLLILTNGADESEIVGFDALPAVRSGAYVVLEYGPVVGINTPTPLSIPYSFEFIRPALEAAAGSR